MHVSEIDTPALVVDLDILERNLCRVAEYTKAHGLRLRPHTKTHKSTRIGRRQLESGAAGLTVAKVSEAEVMLGAAPDDLLVAFPDRRPRQAGAADRGGAADARHGGARQRSGGAGAFGGGAARRRSKSACWRRWMSGSAASAYRPASRCSISRGPSQKLPGLVFEGITFYPGQIKIMDEQGRAGLAQVGELLACDSRGFPARRHRGEDRQRRIDAHAVPFSRTPRGHRDPPGHLRLQRPEYRAQRRLRDGRIARRRFSPRWFRPRGRGR